MYYMHMLHDESHLAERLQSSRVYAKPKCVYQEHFKHIVGVIRKKYVNILIQSQSISSRKPKMIQSISLPLNIIEYTRLSNSTALNSVHSDIHDNLDTCHGNHA